MKPILITLIILHVIILQVSAQIPNSGFENWAVGPGGFMDPVGWTTNSNFVGAAMVQSAPGHSGNFCAQFNYLLPYDGGHIEFLSGPTNIAPLTVTGWWKDQFFDFTEETILKVYVYDNVGDLMGEGLASTGGIFAHPNWIQFTAAVAYTNSNPVGDYVIEIDSWPFMSSYRAYVDDLNMTFTTSSIANADNNINTAYISINGGNDVLHFNSKRNTLAAITIFDISGRDVVSQEIKFQAGEGLYRLDTEQLPAGIYMCAVETTDLYFVKKFISKR